MSDIIQLLPNSVANQIAAGEVVQRPASVVKELLENSIDAKSTKITLNIKDAGKTLIEVHDNGIGMSDTDARMSFERHATSKIKNADDLFNINTKGFRGEALASIAAIAHVEVKTKQAGKSVGVKIEIEGSEVKSQEAVNCPEGTIFSIKNLFYNVPARRKFLKSDNVETKHIIEEFQRVTLVHHNIHFVFINNGKEIFNLKPGNFKQRIAAILGEKYNEKLVPVNEETDIIKIEGFIIKPEAARKTRGEQYFFVNDRFIKNGYLHHAVQLAYSELITDDHHPGYYIKLYVKPDSIDVNIHPTKTEIKFDDEKAIYAILRTAVRQALGKHNVTPTLDFERETSFDNITINQPKEIKAPVIKVDPNYNPFKKSSSEPLEKERVQNNSVNWQKAFETEERENIQTTAFQKQEEEKQVSDEIKAIEFNGKYIVTTMLSGIVIIDKQRAKERIVYEEITSQKQGTNCQQLLFPESVELNSADFELIKDMFTELQDLGFDINEFGKNTLVINGIPSCLQGKDVRQTLDELIEQRKNEQSKLNITKSDYIAKIIAGRASSEMKKTLNNEEISFLVNRLFSCQMPYESPSGKPIVVNYSIEELNKKFAR